MNQLLAAVLVLALLPGWILPDQHGRLDTVQNLIRESLHALLGTPKKLEVFVTDAAGPEDNALDHVRIVVANGCLNDLPLHRGTFEFQNLKLDLRALREEKKLVPLGAARATLNVQIRERDVNRFLQQRTASTNVRDAVVQFERNSISISGYCKWWFIDSRFEVKGTFRLRKQRFIEFFSHSIRLSEVKMPSFIVKRVMNRLNPVLDMHSLPFPVDLQSVRISQGNLYLSSTPR